MEYGRQRMFCIRDRTLAEYEAWAVEVNASTYDSKEGVLSFQEKRTPEWKGY